MDMSRFKKYSSTEVYEVAEMAKAKGLTLLEGNYNEYSYNSNNDSDCKGYCVTKVIADQYFTLNEYDYIYQSHIDGSTKCKTVEFDLTLEEAKTLINDFNGTIINYPRFFAYIRVYDGEPKYYEFFQRLYLDEFAHKHGIIYAEKFVCVGGRQSSIKFLLDSTGMRDVIDCCRKSFEKMDGDSYLVVSDLSRLNDDVDIWLDSYNIIPVCNEDTDYERYEYHESEKIRKRIQDYERYERDRDYRIMSREYEKMKLEIGEPPCLDVEAEI